MTLCSDNDVVDGDVDELDKEPNEAHEAKPDGRGDGDLLELLPVGLGASLDKSDGVLAELFEGLELGSNLVHDNRV